MLITVREVIYSIINFQRVYTHYHFIHIHIRMASETSKIWLDLLTNLQMVIDQVEGILMKIIFPNTCISYLHFYSLGRSRSTLVMHFRDCTIFCMQQVLVFVKYYGWCF